ncbi:MAG: hypothetical protein KatS3mg076_0009 [Candidatus Binatia bacterium]|nr:MAG: hypothetical protein KatS3mg076_0009 [Candidatus Binatia bacterium]
MRGLLPVLVGLALASVGSEFALRGRKVQTALGSALLVWAATGGVLLFWFFTRPSGWGSFSVFWSGAFLAWFGVRSHVESSILLRMVYLLGRGPKNAEELLEEYERFYGSQQRVEELVRSGLLERRGNALAVTRKGRTVLLVARALRGRSAPASNEAARSHALLGR